MTLLLVVTSPANTLLNLLHEEIAPEISDQKINVKYLLENCPLSDAIINETLRLSTSATSARDVESSIIVGCKKPLAGAKAITP